MRRMEGFAGKAYDIKSAASSKRLIGREFYVTPLPQRPLSRSFQNDSSSGKPFFQSFDFHLFIFPCSLIFIYLLFKKKKSIFRATNRRLGFSVFNSIYILCITEGEPSISILHHQRCARLRGSCAQAQLWQ